MKSDPSLSPARQRAIWAITHCRTPAMGGFHYACKGCGNDHFAFHSCNHKACPRCGKAATAAWVERGLEKRVNAPYFLVTFTLPEELRSSFFGPFAKEFYDLFFTAVSAALSETLATAKGFKAVISGATAVLHTWGQQMQFASRPHIRLTKPTKRYRAGFHPHLHFLVPGAGINAKGKVICVKKADYLLHLPLLQAAFRQHFRRLLALKGWQADPAVWTKSWGVHIQAAGSGSQALKYLGTYVARSVISDHRIVSFNDQTVTFQWKDRSDKNRPKGFIREMTVTGTEFVRRYLRHVLPVGLRSIRYYGYLHPAAVRKRERVRMFTGSPIFFGPRPKPRSTVIPTCPSCQQEMACIARIPRHWVNRGPPSPHLAGISR